AGPGPDAVGCADGIGGFEPGVPGGRSLDDAVADGEQDDAVAIDVVDDGVPDDDIAGARVGRAALVTSAGDDDAGPAVGVVGGDSVDNNIFEELIAAGRNDDEAGDLGLHLAGRVDAVDDEID